jgi:DNA-binding beta-propeller fold protein YncE
MRYTLPLLLLLANDVGAQTAPTYWQDIRPVFRKHCTVCHSAKNLNEPDVSGGLVLDSYGAALKGSERKVIQVGQSGESPLVKLLVSENVKRRMPLDAPPLPMESIELIRRWIDGGAREGMQTEAAREATVMKKAATRKLDIFLPTSAIPPAGLLGKAAPAKLELGLRVGPLAPVVAVAFSPDNKLLASGSYGQVAIWDLAAGRPVKVLTNVLGAVNDLKFSPDGTLLAVAGGQPSAKGDLRLYQVADWKLLATLRGHDDVVFSVAFRPDGKQLASASFDHTVRLWDVATRESLRTYKHHSDFVYAVAFSPDGKQLASASKDHTVQLFDVATGKSVFTMSGMELDVMALAFSPDGKALISSGFEAGLYVWSPQTGERLKLMPGHSVATHELAFSKDGKRIVSAGADRTLRTWDPAAGTLVKSLPVGSITYAAAISADGKRLASGSFDGVVRVWDEATGRPLVAFLAIAGDHDQPEWLALTPEGYTAGSDKLLAQAHWRMGGQDMPADVVWTALRQPDQVARASRGETVAAPTFKGDAKGVK